MSDPSVPLLSPEREQKESLELQLERARARVERMREVAPRYLRDGTVVGDDAAATGIHAFVDDVRKRLRLSGYVDGENCVVEDSQRVIDSRWVLTVEVHVPHWWSVWFARRSLGEMTRHRKFVVDVLPFGDIDLLIW